VVEIKNAICIHEEDAGVLWKHTDYRPNGRSYCVRNRRLVISMVCTLANYGAYRIGFKNRRADVDTFQNISGITTSTKTGRLSSKSS